MDWFTNLTRSTKMSRTNTGNLCRDNKGEVLSPKGVVRLPVGEEEE
jgi:hypothetical protein